MFFLLYIYKVNLLNYKMNLFEYLVFYLKNWLEIIRKYYYNIYFLCYIYL